MKNVLFMGVGDLHVERDDGVDMFRHVQTTLDEAELLFANAEQMYSPLAGVADGHTTYNHPNGDEFLKDVGFDIISLANNHTMDWGADVLLDTIKRIEAQGIRCVGAGATIQEARAAKVVEVNGLSVGFLAYCCIGPFHYAAGEDTAGYAPMHARTFYEQVDLQPGTPPVIRTLPEPDELLALIDDVKRLRQSCDVVVVSFHWGVHFVPFTVPEYCYSVGHACVDAGAHLVIGTQPHMLKGFEIYHGSPIFYSTGNFALEMDLNNPAAHQRRINRLGMLMKHYGFSIDPAYPSFPMHPDGKYSLIVEADLNDEGVAACRVIPVLINGNAEPEVVSRGTPEGERVVDYIRQTVTSEGLNAQLEWTSDSRLAIEPLTA